MKEKWRSWGGTEIPKEQYEVLEVKQNAEGTLVVLESSTVRLVLTFGFADALRVCDEGRRIKTYHEVEGLRNDLRDRQGGPVYVVEESEFCSWIAEESAGFCTESQHYAVVTRNDIVDVIAPFPPEIAIGLT